MASLATPHPRCFGRLDLADAFARGENDTTSKASVDTVPMLTSPLDGFTYCFNFPV